MLVGLLAGALTTGCWLPQLVRSFRTRNTDSFSWAYLITISTGVALWFAYGLIRADVDIILPNLISFLFTVSLTVLKLRITLRAGAGSPAAIETPVVESEALVP